MNSHKLASIAAFTAGLLGFAPYAASQQTDSAGWFSDVFKTDWSKDFAFSFGTKVWVNEWTTWSSAFSFEFFNPRDPGRSDPEEQPGVVVIDENDDGEEDKFTIDAERFEDQVSSHTSDNFEVVPIPVASVRWKDFFVSASYFAQTDYHFGTLVDAEREEFDVAMGYYVLPPYLALAAGYKYINQKIGPVDYDIDGPTVGFVGAVPMKYGFSLYTNFAFGFLEANSAAFEEAFDSFVLDDDRESNYWLVDTGIAWTYNMKETAPELLLSQATVTLGYRHQQVETEGVATFNDDDDGIDTTRGVALGVNFTF